MKQRMYIIIFILLTLTSLMSCGNGNLGNKDFFITGPDDSENYMALVLLIKDDGNIEATEPNALVPAQTFELLYTDIPPEYRVTVLYYANADLMGKKLFEVSPTEYFGSEFIVEPRMYSDSSLKDDGTESSGAYVPAELSGYLKFLSKHIKFVDENSDDVITTEAPELEFVYPYPETSLSRATTELTLRGKNFFEGIKIEIYGITIQEVVRYDNEFVRVIFRDPLGDAIDNLPLILIMQNPQSASVSYQIQ